MASVVQLLSNAKLATPPKWMPDNVCYETIMGSVAYGVSSDTSDMDVYGFCMPPKDILFPHLSGNIYGFDNFQSFEQYQQHHIKVPVNTKGLTSGQEYDIVIYNVVKFIALCMENNPNMVDSLFTPTRCVLYINQIGQLVKDNRKLFLHKGCYPKFIGYAYSQLSKLHTKEPKEGSKRDQLVKAYGYDVKFAYHIVRLLRECEQVMIEHDIDLERSREELKSIRRGEWTEEQIRNFFDTNKKSLEELKNKSTLPELPNEPKIKQLLVNCMEVQYGSLSKMNALEMPEAYKSAFEDIKRIVNSVEVDSKPGLFTRMLKMIGLRK